MIQNEKRLNRHFPLSLILLRRRNDYVEYEIGSKAFIIESNRILREVTIVRKNSDFYIVRFDNNGSIQLRKSRIFPTREAAEQHLSKKDRASQTSGSQSPYQPWH